MTGQNADTPKTKPDNTERNREIFALYDRGLSFGQIEAKLKPQYPSITRGTVAGACGRAGKRDRGSQSLIDLTGQVFGRLTVIRRAKNGKRSTRWLCKCSCGRLHEAFAANLTQGGTTSCGHPRRERAMERMQAVNVGRSA